MFEEQAGQSLTPRGRAGLIGSDMPKREPELSRVFSRQSSVLGELEAVCEMLAMRLAPIARSEAGVVAGASEKRAESGVAIVRAVDENTDRIQRVAVTLSNLIERLEV